MWIHKKIIFCSLVFLVGFLPSPDARAEKKIGVLLFSNETRYSEAARGFMDALGEAGFKGPQITVVSESAAANKAKAAEVVHKFSAAKMDLIFTAGTHATTAVSHEIKDIPIVFSVVYDPVGAGIAKSWKSSGNNTTGTSSRVPMSKLLERLKQYAQVKRLAVLYTPGETNSEQELKDIQEVQADYGITVTPIPLTRVEEFDQLLPLVVRRADALCITGSNLVNSEISRIADMTIKAKVITVTHLQDLVEKGVLLGVCPDSYMMGRLAGRKAVRILKGAKPSAIPIESLNQLDSMINLKTAKAGGFPVSPDFMKTVKTTVK